MSSDHKYSNELPLAGYSILLVEDDLTAKELLTDLLQHSGAIVNSATTAREALELLPQFKPDILISNILLPGENGYYLIQQVRGLAPEQGGQIPAIAVTAAANEVNRTYLLEVGFQAYLFKPFEPDELISSIITHHSRVPR